jgi:hypothetical protein
MVNAGKGSITPLSRIRRQRGAATLLTVSALMGSAVALVLFFSASVSHKAVLDRALNERAELEAAISTARQWYESAAPSLEAAATVLSESQFKSMALGQPYPGLRFAISNQLGLPCTGVLIECAPYRVIVAWRPPPSNADTTDFNALTGVFTPDPDVQSATYNSRSFQQKEVEKSLRSMQRLGLLLEKWSRLQSQVVSKGYDQNFFRADDCANPGVAIMCLDNFVDLSSTDIPTKLGLDAQELRGNFGSLQVSNQGATTSPYTISLRVVSPWGATATQQVIQVN